IWRDQSTGYATLSTALHTQELSLTLWVNGDNGYIAMQVSGLEVLPGAGLTDSGLLQKFHMLLTLALSTR
ncbi:MAG: hypothetical protein V7732_04010, partial [Halomonas aquamarina]